MRNALCVKRQKLITHYGLRFTDLCWSHSRRLCLECLCRKAGRTADAWFCLNQSIGQAYAWELIEKRLDAAAKADFVIILYNPKSKGRVKHIDRAREIILKCRKPETPVGIVKGAMRENERVIITDLKNMLLHDIDMQTTVIIGNSQTFVWDSRMITPRGYEGKLKVES